MALEFDAALITEFTVLVLWGLSPWYLFITYRESKQPFLRSLIPTALVLLFGFWVFGSLKFGIDIEFFGGEGSPLLDARPVLYLFATLVLMWLFRWRLVGDGLSQHWLIGLQVLRLGGGVFILEHLRGNGPALFAYPAGIGDMLTGLIALAVIVSYRNRPIPRRVIWFVFIFGLVDFAMIFGLSFILSGHCTIDCNSGAE